MVQRNVVMSAFRKDYPFTQGQTREVASNMGAIHKLHRDKDLLKCLMKWRRDKYNLCFRGHVVHAEDNWNVPTFFFFLLTYYLSKRLFICVYMHSCMYLYNYSFVIFLICFTLIVFITFCRYNYHYFV